MCEAEARLWDNYQMDGADFNAGDDIEDLEVEEDENDAILEEILCNIVHDGSGTLGESGRKDVMASQSLSPLKFNKLLPIPGHRNRFRSLKNGQSHSQVLACKWRKNMDLPMYAAGTTHYYANEVARLVDDTLVIPIRWIIFRDKV
ncbi:hypothetical protein B0H19DRAFT_1077273 [Mycena capillaripes]|nr:hypothetical protein B0H19DRAFT_1077273 [Mycena capillaripes]